MSDKVIVHENNNYIVQIGKSIHNENTIDCYQIVNRKYGVIEAETTMLPSALATADDLDESLDEEEGEKESTHESSPTIQ